MDEIKYIPLNDNENDWESKIKARCPKCFNIKTELRESGPINAIRCVKCGFLIREGSFPSSGKGYVIDLIDEWNRVGDYTHRD